ncbi:MAG: hypothetical protein JNM58_06045 [Xanthomonadaceae bacterium]|nr:hypothetical protein [Xanthomonadaceae bacterium]
MNDEIRIIVAATRSEALAKLDLLNQAYRIESSGYRRIVTFEDLADPTSGYGREEDLAVMYCVVARI